MIDSKSVGQFINEQLAEWPSAAANYDALKNVEVKDLDIDGMKIKIQFNPARAVSSGAKVDAASIKARKCFLCRENRPSEQRGIEWEDFTILVNPFPIFPRHLTISRLEHVDQYIGSDVGVMFRLAKQLDGYTVFYNGPRCGASAPDHMHLQAGNSDFLPLDDIIKSTTLSEISRAGNSVLYAAASLPLRMFVIDADSEESMNTLFSRLYANLPIAVGDAEPMFNLLCYTAGDKVRLVIIPRKRHRPSFYGTEGEDTMMISPASVDLGGVIITPRRIDFDRINADTVRRLFDEVGLSSEDMEAIIGRLNLKKEPVVEVGILNAPTISFRLSGVYTVDGQPVDEYQTVSIDDNGQILWNGRERTSLMFKADSGDATFELQDVVIGVNFHWERKENQRFKGDLSFLVENGLWAVNHIPVEEYLISVISSEMSANASLHLLKAHAVISRSWLLAQIEKQSKQKFDFIETDQERIRWYDREDHRKFHVCADDHCQRYQGIGRQSTPIVEQAVNETRGIVLVDRENNLCDARFSKSCGGVFEEFENCWEPIHYHYLEALRDDVAQKPVPDLRNEDNAREWIMGRPASFCDTTDSKILGQVLNDYDQETTDFYRWTVKYSQQELSELILKRTGIDFGQIKALEPVSRGTSGRLIKLKITGSKRTMTIGKELEIRRSLSNSHLYSSAFVVDTEGEDSAGVPSSFILHGAGWGHGVGLCQIGAAVMGAKGYSFDQILSHYYPESKISHLYE